MLALLVAALLLSPAMLGSGPFASLCSVKLVHVSIIGVEAEREEFLFLLERSFNARGIAFTDDEAKADVTIRCTIRVTYAMPMWAFSSLTVRDKSGRVLWRDYLKENAMEVVAEHAARSIVSECQKGWPQLAPP